MMCFVKLIRWKTADSQLLGMFLILIYSIRFFIVFLIDDQVGFEERMNLNMDQFFSIPLVLF